MVSHGNIHFDTRQVEETLQYALLKGDLVRGAPFDILYH
jgi:hypothetical protein